MLMAEYFNHEPYCSIADGTLDDAAVSKDVEKLSVAKHPPLPTLETLGKKAYSESKIIGEQMAADIVKNTPKSIICVRIGCVNIDDHPRTGLIRTVWLSYRDLCSFIDKALQAPLTVSGTYFAISNNYRLCIDLDDAKRDLGYVPQDGAEKI
jgi:hypothetical protein